MLFVPTTGGVLRIELDAKQRDRLGDRVEERYEQQLACVTGKTRGERRGVLTVGDPSALVVAEPQPAVRFPLDVARTCDPGVRLPQVVRDVKPQYTAEAMRAKVEGRIVVQGVVDVTGIVSEARVVHGLDPGLDEEVRTAFLQWRFRPGTRDGAPVAMTITLESAFTAK